MSTASALLKSAVDAMGVAKVAAEKAGLPTAWITITDVKKEQEKWVVTL